MKALLMVLAMAVASPPLVAEVYKCERDGQTVFQDTRCVGAAPRSESPGSALVVSVAAANVYDGPADQFDFVIALTRGTQLIEFSRVGEWIEVGIHKAGGKSGWIYRDHVAAKGAYTGKLREQPVVGSANFAKFKQAFDALSAKITSQTGIVLFTDVWDQGDGIIEVVATDNWLSAPYADRRKNMQTILNLWEAAEGSGLVVFVNVLDKNGRKVDSISNR